MCWISQRIWVLQLEGFQEAALEMQPCRSITRRPSERGVTAKWKGLPMGHRHSIPPKENHTDLTRRKPWQKWKEGVQLCSLSTPPLPDHPTPQEGLPYRFYSAHTFKVRTSHSNSRSRELHNHSWVQDGRLGEKYKERLHWLGWRKS